jgi:hypothetical protein
MTADLARHSLGLRYLSAAYTTLATLVVCLTMFAALVFGVVEDCAPEVEPEPMFIRDGLRKEPATYPTIWPADRCDPGWSPKVDWVGNDLTPRS